MAGYSQKNENRIMLSNPLVSIIVPIYNAEKTLDSCITSILKQSYVNIEVILVDDGSTDNSLCICRRFAAENDNVRVITQENLGSSIAREIGVRVSTGELIAFVDADDVIHRDMIKHLIEVMRSEQADISTVEKVGFRNISTIDANSVFEHEIRNYTKDEYLRLFFKIGSQKTVYYMWGKLFRRDLLENCDISRHFFQGEDVVALYSILQKCGRIACSDAGLYFYRGKSRRYDGFEEDILQLTEVWDLITEMAAESRPEDVEYAKINRKRINFTILSQYALMGLFRDSMYKKRIDFYIDELKKSASEILAADIAPSRKLLIRLYCINYRLTASVIYRFRETIFRRIQEN